MSKSIKMVRVILSPNSETSPLSLWYHIVIKIGINSEVKVKEKAYGLLIKGPKDRVDKIVVEVKKIDPCNIFTTEATPLIKGHNIFRGFLQLSGELRTLNLISQALGKTKIDSKIEGRLVRCRYTGTNPIALLIDEGKDRVRVRCPEMMMLYGSHACGYRCPYGELTYS